MTSLGLYNFIINIQGTGSSYRVCLTRLRLLYYQENKSSKIMESFAKMIPPKAKVLREGKVVEVDAVDLVVGDVVDIQGGDKTPADIRIIESHGLKVDNSRLTRDSVPVALKPDTQGPEITESKNIAFYSFTTVVEGKARGVIIKTGNDTLKGLFTTVMFEIKAGANKK